MASLDFAAKVAFQFAFEGTISANTNTAAIDTQGFDGVAFATSVRASNVAEGTEIDVNFLESDDSNIANATAVERVVFNPPISEANTVIWASPVPAKRYLFAQYIPRGAGQATVHALGALGYARNEPTYNE